MPHAGCPQQCSFCGQKAITGREAAPAPQEVWDTAQRAAARLGERVGNTQLAFFGGSFTAIPRSQMLSLLEPAAQAVAELGFGGIRCSTRPDAIDQEVLEVLRRYRVRAIELGAQSMFNEVLSANRRGHTAFQTEQAAGLIRAGGFELGLQMMTGLWQSGEARDLETARRLIALGPDTARVYPTLVLPGTYLAELYKKGAYRPQTLEEAVALCARLLDLFERAGVRVIRMGLHAQRRLEEELLAGPYHPAFRELVQSRLFLTKLLRALRSFGPGAYEVSVSPKSLSAWLGQRRENLVRLEQAGFSVRFLPAEGLLRNDFQIKPL